MSSGRDFCILTASTKRNSNVGGVGSGEAGPLAPYLAGVAITPLYPVSAGTVQMLELARAREMHECYHVPLPGAALPDIAEGDSLVVGGLEYRVDSVAEWPDWEIPALHIVVAEIKQNA